MSKPSDLAVAYKLAPSMNRAIFSPGTVMGLLFVLIRIGQIGVGPPIQPSKPTGKRGGDGRGVSSAAQIAATGRRSVYKSALRPAGLRIKALQLRQVNNVP